MPLVFIHVALTTQVAGSVQALIKHQDNEYENNEQFNAENVTTAVFSSKVKKGTEL